MNIVIDICLGIVLACAAISLKGRKLYEKIIAIAVMVIMLILHFAGISEVTEEGSFDMMMLAVHYGIVAALFVSGLVIGIGFPGVREKAVGLWMGLSKEPEEDEAGAKESADESIDDEEDFMKTKLGRIMTVLCVLLVIYMFVSAFCIYRLNAKINSVYNITQELQENK